MGLFRKQVVLFKSLKAHPYHTVKMVREDRTAWKTSYFQRIEKLIEEYPTCFLVSADNVGSKQMQQIRIALRGKGEVLMGKNTMMRKAIRGQLSKYPQLEKLLPCIVGNVGFVFTNEALAIPTKITKGTIEILSDIHLVKKDEKVGASEAALLQMLNIKPFHYGLVVSQVYDNGAVFSPEILDITDE